LGRRPIGVEIDPENIKCISNRLSNIREADNIQKYYKDYIHTEKLEEIWGDNVVPNLETKAMQEYLPL